MRVRRGHVLTVASLCFAGLISTTWSCTSSPSSGGPPSSDTGARRRFEFDYETKVSGFPADAKTARIWLPLPVTDEAQTVDIIDIETPLPHRICEEKQYGNRLLYIEARAPLPHEIPIRVSVAVERREVKSVAALAGSPPRARLLLGDELAPLNDEARTRAVHATEGKEGNEAKARGIYDQVLRDVDYDKSGTGWGRGSLAYVCAAGKGNCSDFHSLFIAMARAENIPALFEIGFPLPLDESEGTIGGYHCWAWYEAGNGSWRPVDASEADKNPEKTDYFFGTLCENRVAFARGRDLQLEPPQDGGPVNFLIYPYVEVDGRTDIATIEKSFRFKDL